MEQKFMAGERVDGSGKMFGFRKMLKRNRSGVMSQSMEDSKVTGNSNFEAADAVMDQ